MPKIHKINCFRTLLSSISTKKKVQKKIIAFLIMAECINDGVIVTHLENMLFSRINSFLTSRRYINVSIFSENSIWNYLSFDSKKSNSVFLNSIDILHWPEHQNKYRKEHSKKNTDWPFCCWNKVIGRWRTVANTIPTSDWKKRSKISDSESIRSEYTSNTHTATPVWCLIFFRT